MLKKLLHSFFRKGNKTSKVTSQIIDSGYWDEPYYLSQISDFSVTEALEHYLEIGWKEGKNPSQRFDTRRYLQDNPDVAQGGVNPLKHYVLYGQYERRNVQEVKKSPPACLPTKNWFLQHSFIPKLQLSKPVDLIIPVYNGFEYLQPLFESIRLNTSIDYRILLCDDSSPDERVWKFLKKLKEDDTDERIVLLKNKQNLGFVHTVNRLASLAENHFVIVNTDIEVPPYWLERLMYPIVSMPNVATTTPFTNAGTICSFPNYLEDNEMVDGKSVEEVDAVFQYVNFEKTFIEIPTGVGFCMGVNKNVVDEIGMFDPIFGKGYGEENDFCQRAIKAGYRNLHVTNLFVYHKHGGSFNSKEKKQLVKKNLKLVESRYPSYLDEVDTIISENKLEMLRAILYFKLRSQYTQTVAIIDHELGGGSNSYRDEKINTYLSIGSIVCVVKNIIDYNENYLICTFLDQSESFECIVDSYQILFELLGQLSIDKLFLNSLVSFPDFNLLLQYILNYISKHNIDLIIPLHDYYPLCPNYTLLYQEQYYCELPDDTAICRNCLRYMHKKEEFPSRIQTYNIEEWRSIWQRLLHESCHIVCFSKASKEIFIKVYPELQEKIKIEPHNIKGKYSYIYENKKNQKKIIGVIGGINIAKGAKVIESLVKYIERNHIDAKVVLIGEVSQKIDSEIFVKTGKFTPETLPDLIKAYEISEFLLPSIWPETFSYVTDEIMQMGYPITVFDIGAPAERVKHYEKGRVIKISELYSSLFWNNINA